MNAWGSDLASACIFLAYEWPRYIQTHTHTDTHITTCHVICALAEGSQGPLRPAVRDGLICRDYWDLPGPSSFRAGGSSPYVCLNQAMSSASAFDLSRPVFWNAASAECTGNAARPFRILCLHRR